MDYKDMFLNQIKNENTKKSYENLFFKIRKLENALNKNIEDFTEKKEFLLLLEYCCGKSTYNSIYVKWSLIKMYFKYIGNNNIEIINNKEYEIKRYIPKEQLIKEINKLENYSDRAMILLMRNGIGAEVDARDLIELKIKDIDFKNNKIYNKK